MIQLNIPDFGDLTLAHIVTDYNGTLALDGRMIPGVAEVITTLAPQIEVHIVTADTFGLAKAQLAGLPVTLTILPADRQAEGKLDYVRKLGADHVVAIGNGRNDRKMLEAAVLGIVVVQREGAAAASLRSADVVSGGIIDALNLLRHPKRLVATLRS